MALVIGISRNWRGCMALLAYRGIGGVVWLYWHDGRIGGVVWL